MNKYYPVEALDIARHFDWQKKSASYWQILMSYACYPLSSFFHLSPEMSYLMGAIFIGHSKTRVEASSSDIPVNRYVVISWTSASVIYVWWFNGNINSWQLFWSCTRSLLTTELHTQLPFDRSSILMCGKWLDHRKKTWYLWWLSPNNSSIFLY